MIDVRFAPVLAQLQATGFVANVSAPGAHDRLQATFLDGVRF